MAPELEGYKKRKIFNDKQIQKIIENRRRFENKIERPSKKISDFVFYINLEKKLEKIRNKKISELGTGLEETDLILQSNIIKIYQKAIYYFNEPFLLKEFTEYCIKKRAYDEMKSALANKCLKNIIDTDLWVFCAQKLWEIEDIEGARGLFMKGVSINNDRRLYIEFFRFECLYAQKLNNINVDLGVEDDEKDDIEKGKVAMIVLEDFIKKYGKENMDEIIEISKIVPGLEESILKLV